ncbi:YjbE family putative metal transport protein [Acidiphilium sp. JA12-A1]|uniref:YjbE family putative metal transport protein n=1 Tax=Acidiphilium sp. JA12-A1 TaxID=1464546 RepID=UPI000461DF8E|nr:YjbE family putative metal transport protein [Acidiphilium sp. JA12-A1]KDM68463.1 integral membrane protein TerC [Acidiphilium sp. JA12-A1]
MGRLREPDAMEFMLADALVLAQVLMIDLVLAGDNAIVIGLAVARLPKAQQKQAILIGVAAATVIRIALALVALRLLAIIGLTLAGGILLLYVVWKSWREFNHQPEEAAGEAPGKLRDAALRIIIADISMSLDNVLAVAGAARDHPALLAAGLLVSVALMGIAANLVARLLTKRRWLVWVGLAIVLYVALEMIHGGILQVAARLGWHLPAWFG